MADQDNISQFMGEVGADASATRISQEMVEIGADGSPTRISQALVEMGAGGAPTRISQLVIELGAAPTTAPPVDTPADTFVFGLGALEVNWWIVPQLSDSGDELRDKIVKPFWVTGRIHNARGKIYRYGATEPIVMSDIEDGLNSATTTLLVDQDEVTRSKLYPVDVPRALLHTIRVEGMWDGTGEPDRIDEMGYQVARSGVRR